MTDREKLTELIRTAYVTIPPHVYKAAVDDTAAAVIADVLISNSVVVREKSAWILNNNGSATCKKCHRTAKDAWDFDRWMNFCPCCGADMRGELK